jgi:hypothetical protein
MRNIQTREGYKYWDKICAVQSYAFLLSPDGRRVVKTPDVGDWIDKHEAQVIVDHAQEDINELAEIKDELLAALIRVADLNDKDLDGQVVQMRNAIARAQEVSQ